MNKRLNQDASRTRTRRGLTAAALTAATLAAGAIGAGGASAAPAKAPLANAPVISWAEAKAEARQLERDRRDYDRLFEKAEKLGVEPKRNTSDRIARASVLKAKHEALRQCAARAKNSASSRPRDAGTTLTPPFITYGR